MHPSLVDLAPKVVIPDAKSRILALLCRSLNGTTAACIPIRAERSPVIVGDLGIVQLDAVASHIQALGTGIVIEHLYRQPIWKDLASGFQWLIGIPLISDKWGEQVLVVLGKEARSITSEDQYTLVEFSKLLSIESVSRSPSAHWQSILDSIPHALVYFTTDRHIGYLNRSAIELFGSAVHELVGQSVYDVGAQHERFVEFCESCFNRTNKATDELSTIEYVRRDGSRFTGELTTVPVNGVSGGMLAMVSDVTAWTKLERSLQRKRDQLRTVLNHLPLIMYGLRPDGQILFLKGRGLEMLGVSREDLVGKSVLTHPLFGDCEWESRISEVMAGREQSFKFQFRDKTFDSRNIPVLKADGSVKEIIGVAIDVSDEAIAADVLREASEVAERARLEAEENARRQRSFLASMSHEIRTPLTGIIGFADLLAEEIEGDAQESAYMIQRSGHRLLETLNSVLSLARLESDQEAPDFKDVDIHAEAQEAARLLQPLADQKGLNLQITGIGTHCISDPSIFHRIVTNLVANAIKFTDEGSVHVDVRMTERGAALRVSDTGRGMNPDFIPQLFKPFHRETDHHSEPAGTGLGLTITKKLADLIGCSIAVETEYGRGTTFTVHIPRIPKGYEVEDEPQWEEVTDAWNNLFE